MSYEEELINEVADELKLTVIEKDNFIHDVNNLRGDEWFSIVRESCSLRLANAFENLINKNKDATEEILDDMECGRY